MLQEHGRLFTEPPEPLPTTLLPEKLLIKLGEKVIERPTLRAPSPQDVTLSFFRERARHIREAYQALYEWLTIPYLRDHRTDEERRSWRLTLSRDEREVLNHNKIRTNIIGSAILDLELLPHDLERSGHHVLAHTLIDILESAPPLKEIKHQIAEEKNYERRMAIVQQLDQKVVTALSLLATASRSKE